MCVGTRKPRLWEEASLSPSEPLPPVFLWILVADNRVERHSEDVAKIQKVSQLKEQRF